MKQIMRDAAVLAFVRCAVFLPAAFFLRDTVTMMPGWGLR